MLSTLFAFGLGVVSSILGNFIYDKFFKQQFGKPAEIEVVLDKADKNSLCAVVLTLEGVFCFGEKNTIDLLVTFNSRANYKFLFASCQISAVCKIFFQDKKIFLCYHNRATVAFQKIF